MLVGTLLVTNVATANVWHDYFRSKFDTTAEVVQQAGAVPYTGDWLDHHQLWHSVWCGLGDFGDDHGYEWRDWAAYDYAISEMRAQVARTHQPFPWAAFWDTTHVYQRLAWEQPEYAGILVGGIVRDIYDDPTWYLSIMRKRIGRIITENVPVRAYLKSVGPGPGLTAAISGVGLLLLAVAGCWGHVKLLLFPLPLSFTALFVYCDRGTPYYLSIFFVLAVSCILALIVKLVWASGVQLGLSVPAIRSAWRTRRERVATGSLGAPDVDGIPESRTR